MWVAHHSNKEGLDKYIDSIKIQSLSDKNEEIRNNCLKLLNYNPK